MPPEPCSSSTTTSAFGSTSRTPCTAAFTSWVSSLIATCFWGLSPFQPAWSGCETPAAPSRSVRMKIFIGLFRFTGPPMTTLLTTPSSCLPAEEHAEVILGTCNDRFVGRGGFLRPQAMADQRPDHQFVGCQQIDHELEVRADSPTAGDCLDAGRRVGVGTDDGH